MWKVKGFSPFEVVNNKFSISTADGQGRLKTVHFSPMSFLRKDFTSIAYYPDDPIPADIIPTDLDFTQRIVEPFEWIKSTDKIVTQVLRKYAYMDGRGFYKVIISTQFGTNQLLAHAPVNIFYDREVFMNLARRPQTKDALSSHQSLILARYIEADFDCARAHKLVYGRELNASDKYNFLFRVRKILKTADGRDLFAKLFSSRFGKPMDFNEWRQKIIDSIPEKLTKPLHLDMWMILGKFEPEVRKKLAEAEGIEEDPGRDSRFKLPQGVEANFKEVCKHCDDTHVFKTKDIGGTEVEIECPYCKEEDKGSNVKVQEVLQGNQQIRV